MRLLHGCCLALVLPGCWLSHRAPSDAGARPDAAPSACAACDCEAGEVCVMGSCRAPGATATWARQFHSPSGAATGVSFDDRGALAVGGYVFRAADLGLGPIDASASGNGVLVVLDPDGSPRWARTFPGDAVQVSDVVFDGGTVWMTGMFGRDARVLDEDLRSSRSPDGFVAHASETGAPLAVLQFVGESDDRVMSLSPAGGEAVVAGYYRGPARLGATTLEPGTGAFVATTSGETVRAVHQPAELGADVVYDVDRLAGGDLVVAGYYGAGGPALPEGRGRGDGYVARLDASGSVVWAMGIGGAGEDVARNVVADADGHVYVVAGIGDGLSLDGFAVEGAASVLLSLAPSGELRWARILARGARSATHLAIDAGGGPMVLVSFEGEVDADGFATIASHGGLDVLVASYGPTGAPLQAFALGGEGDDSPGGLATDGCGGFAVVGAFTGELATGAGTLRTEGTDGFVTRWAQ